MHVLSFFLLLGVSEVECGRQGIDFFTESLKLETESIRLRKLLSVDEGKLLSYPILYTFPQKMTCFSVVTDGSMFSKTIRSLLHENSRTPSFLNMPGGKEFDCRGYVSATHSVDRLKKLVVTLKRGAESRILCYVQTGLEKDIDYMLHSELDIFGDAEFTIFVWDLQEFFYRVGQPNRTVEKIKLGTSLKRWEFNERVIQNFYGRTMKITTDNCTVFTRIGPILPDGTTDYFDGSDAMILKAILNKLNLKLKFVEYARGRGLSKFINDSWVGGLLENLSKKRSDAVVCGNWVEPNKMRGGLDMSMPILPLCVTYLVRQELSAPRWMLVFQPFDAYTWAILGITGILFSSAVTAFSKLMSNFEAFRMNDPRYHSFQYSFFTTLGAFISNTWPSLKRELGPLRHLFTGWVFFSFLITCAYSSTLISHLMRPRDSGKPKDIQDLVEGGFSWTTENYFPSNRLWDLNVSFGTFPVDVTNRCNSSPFVLKNPVFRKWAARHKRTSFEQKLEALTTDRREVIVGFKFQKNQFYPYYNELPSDLTNDFEIMDSCMASVYEAFILRSGTPFLDSINYYISQFHENGLVSHFSRQTSDTKELPRPTYYATKKKQPSSRTRSLKTEQLQGIFYLLLVGWIVSCGVLCCEIVAVRLKHKPRSTGRSRFSSPFLQ